MTAPHLSGIDSTDPTTLADLLRLYEVHKAHRALEDAADLEPVDRVRYHLGLNYTRHAQVDEVIAAVQQAVNTRKGGHGFASTTQLVGLAAFGKTRAALAAVFDRYDQQQAGERTVLTQEGHLRLGVFPGIVVKVPAGGELDMSERLLLALGNRFKMARTASSRLEDAKNLAAEHGVEVVVIDDLHKLGVKDKAVGWFKDFLDNFPAHVVITRVIDRPSVVDADEIAMRANRGRCFVFGRPQAEPTLEAVTHFARAVAVHEARLRLLAHPADSLLDEAVLERLYQLSQGRVGAALSLISCAAADAVGNSEMVGLDDLERLQTAVAVA